MEEYSGSAESLSHALLEFVAAVGVGLTGGCAFPDLSKKAAELLNKAPTITKSIAACYPIIVLDEARKHLARRPDFFQPVGHPPSRRDAMPWCGC